MSDSSMAYRLSLTGDGIAIDKDIDQETAMKVVALAFGASAAAAAGGGSTPEPPRPAKRKTPKRAASTSENGESKSTRRRRGTSPGIVKDLSLRPAGEDAVRGLRGGEGAEHPPGEAGRDS